MGQWAYNAEDHEQVGRVREVLSRGIRIEHPTGKKYSIIYYNVVQGVPPWAEGKTDEQIAQGPPPVVPFQPKAPRPIPCRGVSPYGSLHPKRVKVK